MMGYMVDVPGTVVTFLVTGYWIMRNSNEPGEVSVILLGRVERLSDYKNSFKSRFRITIQKSEAGGWDKDLVDEMS